MDRKFVMTALFDRKWKELGLSDDDLARLQQEILTNPKVGPVIEGTGRLRKMRFAFSQRGKSGSTRVTYVDFVIHETISLIYVYAKGEKDNLTKAEKNEFKKMIAEIEKTL